MCGNCSHAQRLKFCGDRIALAFEPHRQVTCLLKSVIVHPCRPKKRLEAKTRLFFPPRVGVLFPKPMRHDPGLGKRAQLPICKLGKNRENSLINTISVKHRYGKPATRKLATNVPVYSNSDQRLATGIFKLTTVVWVASVRPLKAVEFALALPLHHEMVNTRVPVD